MNQWALIETKGTLELVVIEAGGVLVGGTARECANHIQGTWQRGHDAVLLVRDRLGPELADELAPLRSGGVKLLKLGGAVAMTDTCSTVQKAVSVLSDLKDASGIETMGADFWAGRHEAAKTLMYELCGNHSRGLPIDEFHRRFEAYLERTLGDYFEAAKHASGFGARLEKNGTALLRCPHTL